MPKHTVIRPRSILPYRNRNRTSINKKKTRRPLVPPPIKIPEILLDIDNKNPISWNETQPKENERIYEQSRVVDEFIRLFEILKTTTTDKFDNLCFNSEKFLYDYVPGIIMRILQECTKDISDDNKTKIIGLIIAKKFSLYVPNHEEYIKAIEATIDAKTIECINKKSESYDVLKNPNWLPNNCFPKPKMKTKKSAKKSIKKKKKV